MVDVVALNKEIKDLGITQTALANKCGVSRQTINKWLKEPQIISVAHVKKLADALRITDTSRFMAIFFAPDVEIISTETEQEG